MRNRKIQRMLHKSGEKGLSRRDTAGVLDLTPYEAVKDIIQIEKAAAIREAKAKLKELEEAKAAETAETEEPKESEEPEKSEEAAGSGKKTDGGVEKQA